MSVEKNIMETPPLLYVSDATDYDPGIMTDDFYIIRTLFTPSVCFIERSSLQNLERFCTLGYHGAVIIRGGRAWSNEFSLDIDEMIKQTLLLSLAPRLLVMPYGLSLELQDVSGLFTKLYENKKLFDYFARNRRCRDREPFMIGLSKNRLTLRGDLDNSPEVYVSLAGVLKPISYFASLAISADGAQITPEGVSVWIEMVTHFLAGCTLLYEPSQLALKLQYDERYQHAFSTFQQYGT